MKRQVRTDYYKDVWEFVGKGKPSKHHENYAQSYWVEIPENESDFYKLCEKEKEHFEHFKEENGVLVIDSFGFTKEGEIRLYYENISILDNLSFSEMWEFVKLIIASNKKAKEQK